MRPRKVMIHIEAFTAIPLKELKNKSNWIFTFGHAEATEIHQITTQVTQPVAAKKTPKKKKK